MITGGYGNGVLDSTEVLDTEDGKVTMASPMNSKRRNHGMGVITIDNEDRLIVFGGHDDGENMLVNVELYNAQTEKWEMTAMKMNEPKRGFGFLSISLDLANQSLFMGPKKAHQVPQFHNILHLNLHLQQFSQK